MCALWLSDALRGSATRLFVDRKAHRRCIQDGFVDGVSNGRVYGGLAKKPDGTYVGIEMKSDTASRTAEQRAFDGAVSPNNPATATLNGRIITITEVIEQKVP